MEDGADLAEDGEGGFVKDPRAEVVEELVAEGLEEGATDGKYARERDGVSECGNVWSE